MKPKQQALIIQRLAAEQIDKAAAQIRQETAQQVYAVMLRNLFDKHGFEPDKLVQIFQQSVADFEAINSKYAKIEDFYSLLGEIGINVK
jgi:hypothetical protein